MMSIVKHAMATAALLIGAAACSEGDSPDPITNGGTGGSSSGAGGTGGGQAGGGSGGSGGSFGGGGAGGTTPDGGLAEFSAVLEGSEIHLSTSDDVWVQACTRNPRVVQQVEGAWTPLRDDRPEAINLQFGAHYLDGSLKDACRLSLGCDVGGCLPFPLVYSPLVAREYVQVGQASAPTCDQLDAGIDPDASSDAGVRQVPDIESRAPAGAIGVEIKYWRDAQCQTDAITTVVPVE